MKMSSSSNCTSNRTLNVPKELLECEHSSAFLNNKILVSYSDMHEKRPLQFDIVDKSVDSEFWECFQYDLETCCGSSYARDMLYGFVVLEMTPIFRRGQALQAMQRFTSKQWEESMQVPKLENLRKLKKGDFLQDGAWIVLVRMPRPSGAMHVIPYMKRKEVPKLLLELDLHPNNEKAKQALVDLRLKCDQQVHPTDGQLYLCKDGSIIQAVSPNIVCNRCGARGHHMHYTHDEATSTEEYSMMLETTVPTWMNVQPLPSETLQMPTSVAPSKGFEFKIRQTKTTIPLRLARQLKMQGVKIEGDVYNCGVYS